jgi:two-component system, chemotaxis family, chemotaxis protein CheY
MNNPNNQFEKRKRAIIIDDSSFMRKVLSDILSDAKIDIVAEGSDGTHAIELFKYYNPDIIFTDVMMPYKNGLDALLEIRKINPWVKVVVVTSSTGPEIEERSKRLGAIIFIKKPINRDKVLEQLKKI